MSTNTASHSKSEVSNESIIDYLATGKTAKEIAGVTGMKKQGVEKRIRTLRKRFFARSVTELVCKFKGIVPVIPA